MARVDVYEIITQKIESALKEGTVPWQKPWSIGGVPTNLVSKKPYRGINPFILNMVAQANGYASPYWLSFKQAKAKGGSVRKGEKSTPVVFWSMTEPTQVKQSDGSVQEKSFMILRYYNVFNVEQCDNIKYPVIEVNNNEKKGLCESVIAKYLATAEIKLGHFSDAAYYSPARDIVNVPPIHMFNSSDAYYTTFFHELTHSTGHAKRLNRPGVTEGHRFGDEVYSQEELIAEMGASFLSGIYGIDSTFNNSASYIASWLQVFKGDRKMVVKAAAQAQKAVDLIQGISWEKDKEE